MRTPSRLARVLVLIALFTVLAVVPGLAATAPAAAPAVPQVTSTAAFLATLSADVTGPQAPVFATTDCRTTGCSTSGQLCCLACGYAGCDTYGCFNPVRGHCPLFP
jgi:hypothetical protein